MKELKQIAEKIKEADAVLIWGKQRSVHHGRTSFVCR